MKVHIKSLSSLQCQLPQFLLSTLVLLIINATVIFGRIGVSSDIFQHRKLVNNNDEGLSIAGEYIVVLNDNIVNVTSTIQQLVKTQGGKVKFVYNNVFKGAAISGMSTNRMGSFLDESVIKFAAPVSKMRILRLPLFFSAIFE
jgi:hypothetical protein